MILVHYVFPAVLFGSGQIGCVPCCLHDDNVVGIDRTDAAICLIINGPEYFVELAVGASGVIAVGAVRLVEQIVSGYPGIAVEMLGDCFPDLIIQFLILFHDSLITEEKLGCGHFLIVSVLTRVVAAVLRTRSTVEVEYDVDAAFSGFFDKAVKEREPVLVRLTVLVNDIAVPERQAQAVHAQLSAVIEILFRKEILLIQPDKPHRLVFAEALGQHAVNVFLRGHILGVRADSHPELLQQVASDIGALELNEVTVSVIVAQVFADSL